jgi:carboxyl-terminal processing protease
VDFAGGKAGEITLTRDRSQHRDAIRFPARPRYEHRPLAGGVEYIGLHDFSDEGTARDFERDLDRLRNAKAWIIDLRYNGGGSSSIGYRVLAHFIDRTAPGSTWRSRQYIPSFEAWGRPQEWHEGEADKVEPAPGAHFQGRVYVLTSPSTCSAAEDFLIPLKMIQRITQVGEPTCGSTGQPLLFTIYGASARVCTKWDRFPDAVLEAAMALAARWAGHTACVRTTRSLGQIPAFRRMASRLSRCRTVRYGVCRPARLGDCPASPRGELRSGKA